MQDNTLFKATLENWPHLLAKYAAELEQMAKNKKKGYLPQGAPSFLL